jgi:hypothetical protein
VRKRVGACALTLTAVFVLYITTLCVTKVFVHAQIAVVVQSIAALGSKRAGFGARRGQY